MGLSDIQSPDGVLKAIDECRSIGEPAFLEKYEFADTYDYVIDFEGGEYPAKAILGAAHGYANPEAGPLPHGEFNGGVQTNSKLQSLGFTVKARAGATRAKGAPLMDEQRTWIFQGNPKRYDVRAALEELPTITWLVNQYRKQVRAGDAVFMWQAGTNAGVIATAEILTDPAPIPARLRPDDAWYAQPDEEDDDKPRVWLRILRVLDTPLLRSELVNDQDTADLPIITFSNATNFLLEEERHVAALGRRVAGLPGRDVAPEKLFFFTAAGAAAARHLELTLRQGIPIEELAALTDIQQQLQRHAHDGRVFAWGARPGQAAEEKWKRLNPGDICLVYETGKFTLWGRVYAKARSGETARKIWGTDGEQSWDCMYFLDPIEPLDAPRQTVVEALGYQPNYTPQGFEIPAADTQDRLRSRYTVLANFIDSLPGPDVIAPTPMTDPAPIVTEETTVLAAAPPLANTCALSVATVAEAARRRGLLMEPAVYEALVAALKSGKHVVLTGPPGTAKTTLAQIVAEVAGRRTVRGRLSADDGDRRLDDVRNDRWPTPTAERPRVRRGPFS